MQDLLLDVSHLSAVIPTDDGPVRAVRDVSFRIRRGRTLGVVGESGCGKSMMGLSLMRLVPKPGYVEGKITYHERGNGATVDIHELEPGGDAMRRIRGRRISMIFQEPMTALNPVYTVGSQIGEALRLHHGMDRQAARARAVEALSEVGIPGPLQRVDEYPHELSGGMRQRAMIAMALSCGPELLIADEPTTALDVTIQAQILDLLKELKDNLNMAIVMITHDLGVIADMADEIMIMYAGQVVETGSPERIFYQPAHPYTWGLLESAPRINREKSTKLSTIPGTVPSPLNLPEGCAFAPRCRYATEQCTSMPPVEETEPGHSVRCWHADQVALDS
ncbi:MAG: ABC transporter ATP-binding protein [Gemmatimonadetes bacterium]|nr:ABC transporter ATP-binding protein [Gemmatimonadota bacterium]MYD25920.1 ABC transporter ATP-binding protein [Gemmatimonadota bacterium]